MKLIFKMSLGLLFLVLPIFFSGCSSSGGGGASQLSSREAAQFIGQSLAAWENSLDSLLGFFIRANSRKFPARLTPEGNGWFGETSSYSEGGISYYVDLHFQFLNSQAEVITDIAQLVGNVATTKVYGTVNYNSAEETYAFTYGNSRADPFIISNAQGASVLFSGDLGASFTEQGHNIALANSFDNLSIPTSGTTHYPDGSVLVTMRYDNQNSSSANVIFDGTNQALIQIVGDGNYTVNLDDGTVSPI